MTQWSGWHMVGGNGMRVGVDVAVSAVTQSSSTVTFTYDVYTDNAWQYDDFQWLTFGGNSSGTVNYNNTQAQGAIRRATRQYTYTYPAGSFNTSPGSTSFYVAVGGAYNGSAPGITVTTPIPPRPGGAVAPPTGVALTRDTDQAWTLTWEPQPTGLAPYVSQGVYMQTLVQGSSGGWAWQPGPTTNHYSLLATVGPEVSSYSQSNAGPNLAYRAGVIANGRFSASPLAASNYMLTTPAAPSGLAVERGAGGSTATLYWEGQHPPGVGVVYQIEYRLDGGPWTSEVADLAEQAVSWQAVLPGQGTVEYRIRAHHPGQPISSVWRYFAPVANAFPPLAPVALAPDGQARDAYQPIELTWRHRNAGDGARESAYEVRWSGDGGATWTSTGQQASVGLGSSHTIPGGTLPNGPTWQWQVRTWGVTSAGPGAWSASATLPTSTTPAVLITAPGATQEQVPLTATWVYSQPESFPQVRWEARLYAAAGSDPTLPNSLVEQRDGTGAAGSVTFTHRIEDGSHYRVEVRAQSSAGLWSPWAAADTVVDLPLPAEPTVSGSYDVCTGVVVLQLDSLAPLPGEALITHVALERRISGGDWVTLAESLPLPTTFVDTLPSTVGENLYRVTAWSGAPSWRTLEVVVNGLDGPGSTDGLWVFLSYGAGFEHVLRFRGDPGIGTSSGRTRKAQHFAGRQAPVLLIGENTQYVVDVAGSLHYADAAGCGGVDPCRYDSPPRDWEAAGLEAGMVAYRDFHGRRMFGMLSDVQVQHRLIGHADVSFSLTRVDSSGLRVAGGGSMWVDQVPRGAAPGPGPGEPPPDGADRLPATLPMRLA